MDPKNGEAALAAAAAAGSEEAFRRLVEPLARELHRFCYRMLGSFHDAEDVLQEAQLKAWRGLARFDGRASFRTWMYRVVTNAALDALRSRRRRVLPQDLGGPRDPGAGLGDRGRDIPWLEPYPDSLMPGADPSAAAERNESVRLAFVHALQLLPPRQRAVLILRDVLDWSAAETAEVLDTTVAGANSALQRARRTVQDNGGGMAEVAEGPGLDARRAELADRYVAAWEAGDVDAIVAILTDEATHAMPPWSAWFVGREALRELYAGYPVWKGRPRPGLFRILTTSLNGQLAWGEYCRDRPAGPYKALALTVATTDPSGRFIAHKVSFVDRELLPAMGLPAVIQ